MENMVGRIFLSSKKKCLHTEPDRISQLPEDVIGQILFFLPAKDAAGMSILSKKWLRVWNTLPVFNFCSDALHVKENLFKQDGTFEAEADKYMDSIDRSLEKLRHCKVRIQRFQLDLFDSHERQASRFNQFIELANKNQVKELVIHGLVSLPWKKASLPLATFSPTNSFRLVDLKACEMKPELLRDETRFPCLQKLSLYEVELLRNDMLENLLNKCPLLEEFSLVGCEVERVELRGHPKLTKVRIVGVAVVRVEDKNVQNFHWEYNGVKPLLLHISSCRNLKVFSLSSNFTVECIQKLLVKSPVLEKLILRPCIPLERLKISSPSLKCLMLCTGHIGGAKEVEIDARNLQSYYHHYYSDIQTQEEKYFHPKLVLINNAARLHVAQLSVSMGTHNLPTYQWFIHLKKCLESFEYNTLAILMDCDMTSKDLVQEKLRQISAAPSVYFKSPVYLKSLSVQCYSRSFDFSALLDCCFLICRPKVLYIWSNSCASETDLVNRLRDKLIPWEENSQCCRNSQRKCWWHYLEDVKIEYIWTSPPESYRGERKHLTVQLKWKMSSPIRN